MFGWGTQTGWTNAASPQLRANASEARSLEPSPDQTGAGLNSGGETADETVDAKTTHGFVAKAEARELVAPSDEAPAPHD